MSIQKLIKPIIRVGNSAGVLLPKEWLNGKAKIELIEKPVDIKSESLQILNSHLDQIQGIYIVGSHARREETSHSDIDILGITSNLNLNINKGRYHIILISLTELEKQLENNALPLLPMIREASPILNSELIKKYDKTKLTKNNLKWHIETTKSALKVVEKLIEIEKTLKNKEFSGGVYSLILRLRTLYLINCLKENKIGTSKGLISLIRKITGNDNSYKIYLSEKNKRKLKEKISLDEGQKLIDYISKKIHRLEI
jgi:predicted nucleotidyltransferase